MRQNFPDGAKWEKLVGYSRAVRVGNMVYISGTTASDTSTNIEDQTRHILHKIEQSLLKAGSGLKDVVRTRIYTTDITQWEKIGKVHAEYFKNISPATSMLEVKALISPEILVEIEADAMISDRVTQQEPFAL